MRFGKWKSEGSNNVICILSQETHWRNPEITEIPAGPPPTTTILVLLTIVAQMLTRVLCHIIAYNVYYVK